MAAGDVKLAYGASSNLDVTNLHSLDASQTHVSGWESDEIDNSANKYLDYLVSAKFTTHASNRQVGEIRLWCVPRLDDSNYPGGFDGVDSVEATPLDDEGGTNAGAVLLKVITVDATASQVYYMHQVSVAAAFGGICPEKFVLFVTSSATTTTTDSLHSADNQVTIKGIYMTVAQS